MARITIEDLAVSSFFTGGAEPWNADDGAQDVAIIRTNYGGGCICTADISTCSRTSPQGGCDTSVQCVTG
jgi:hypothetical protein